MLTLLNDVLQERPPQDFCDMAAENEDAARLLVLLIGAWFNQTDDGRRTLAEYPGGLPDAVARMLDLQSAGMVRFCSSHDDESVDFRIEVVR
jgi:hypothetical protein